MPAYICVMLGLLGTAGAERVGFQMRAWEVAQIRFDYQVNLPVQAKRLLAGEVSRGFRTTRSITLDRIEEVIDHLERTCREFHLDAVRLDITVLDRGNGRADLFVVFNDPKVPAPPRILRKPTLQRLDPVVMPGLRPVG